MNTSHTRLCQILGSGYSVEQIFSVLLCFAVSVGIFLPTFSDIISVQSAMANMSAKDNSEPMRMYSHFIHHGNSN